MFFLKNNKFNKNRRLRGNERSKGNRRKQKSLSSTNPFAHKNSRSKNKPIKGSSRINRRMGKTTGNRRHPVSGEWKGSRTEESLSSRGMLSRLGKAADSFESRERGPLGKIFRLLTPLIVLAGLGFGGYYAYQFVTSSPHFEVSKVTFNPTEKVSKKTLLKLSGLSSRPNIFSLDLKKVAKNIEKHPWVAKAKAYRKLPSRVHIEIEEEEPAAVVLLDSLYLINNEGKVFKRSNPNEAMVHTLITGVGRKKYKSAPKRAEKRFKRALTVLRKYRRKRRPPVGEIHLSRNGGVVLYTKEKGVEIRLGKGSVDAKLLRLDSVFTALGKRSSWVQVIRLDNRVRPNRITVRLVGMES